MSKKRAFVRYSKQGKIVPGSLILTSGSHPNGPSTWKEVPADLCCDSGGCTYSLSEIIVCTTIDSEIIDQISIIFKISGSWGSIQLLVSNNTSTTYEEFVEYLNLNLSSFGKFTYSVPNQICLQIASEGPLKYAVLNYPFSSSYSLEIITL